MKFSKLLIIIAIVFLLSICVMNTSFAAVKKSESISSDKISQIISEDCYKSKISEINRIDIYNRKDDRKGNFKFSVKKAYQNKYKIKSVKVLYIRTYTDWNIDETIEKKVYKTYKPKNKKILTIKDLSASENTNGEYAFVKIIINYKTKKNLKQETVYLKKPYKYKSTMVYKGKTATVKDITEDSKKKFIHKVKVKTTSSKYKIKTFKVIFYIDVKIVGTIYGYGRTSLVVDGPQYYDSRAEGDFKITYY